MSYKFFFLFLAICAEIPAEEHEEQLISPLKKVELCDITNNKPDDAEADNEMHFTEIAFEYDDQVTERSSSDNMAGGTLHTIEDSVEESVGKPYKCIATQIYEQTKERYEQYKKEMIVPGTPPSHDVEEFLDLFKQLVDTVANFSTEYCGKDTEELLPDGEISRRKRSANAAEHDHGKVSISPLATVLEDRDSLPVNKGEKNGDTAEYRCSSESCLERESDSRFNKQPATESSRQKRSTNPTDVEDYLYLTQDEYERIPPHPTFASNLYRVLLDSVMNVMGKYDTEKVPRFDVSVSIDEDEFPHLNRSAYDAQPEKNNFVPYSLDSLVKKNFDPIDRSAFSSFAKKNFDPIDRSAFSSFAKKNFDPIDRSAFNKFAKKNFDPIDRSALSRFIKKNFDPIDRSSFNSFVKKNFDPIDRSGFSAFLKKKNFDPIDSSGFSAFLKKKNFDPIDHSAYLGFSKKNFDPIDRSSFNSFVKKDVDVEDLSKTGENSNVDDRSVFNHLLNLDLALIDALAPKEFINQNPDHVSRSLFGESSKKKDFDLIDRSNFDSFMKKSFDPIDRSGFDSLVKKSKAIDNEDTFKNDMMIDDGYDKKNFDPIDRSGFDTFVKKDEEDIQEASEV